MTSQDVKQTDYYKKIYNMVLQVKEAGLLEKGFGQCLGMSDIILNLLHYKENIDAEIAECSLMVLRKDPPGVYLVGYPGFIENHYNKNERMENHVICITKTEVPILIDLSITSVDPTITFICEPIVNEGKEAGIAEFEFPNSTWIYQRRRTTGLPKLYQRSILNRIETEAKTQREFKFIKKVLLILFLVSFINAIRGFYDFYLTFILKSSTHIETPIDSSNQIKIQNNSQNN